MIPYKIQHVPKGAKGRRPQIKMTPKYLTIHSTGNPNSTAQNERDNLANNNPDLKVSFHIVVDDKQAIECIPFNEVAYHAGDGKGSGNMASIGLEICEGGNRERTLRNAIVLSAYILNKYGWGTDRLRQHYDWSGKNCPRILRNTNRWTWFVSEIKKELDKMKKEMFKDVKKDDYAYNHIKKLLDFGIVNGDVNGNYKPDEYITRRDVAIMIANALTYLGK